MRADDRYQHPIAGIPADQLPAKMTAAIQAVEKIFPPGTGIAVFTFDRGKPVGGIAYIANAVRADMIKALTEWIRNQRGRN